MRCNLLTYLLTYLYSLIVS